MQGLFLSIIFVYCFYRIHIVQLGWFYSALKCLAHGAKHAAND